MRWMVAIAAVFLLSGCTEQQKEGGGGKNDWLLNTREPDERLRMIQQQFRGFDQPMWEIGERFSRMHEALGRGNHELASYHWEKIKTTLENGLTKRPARRASADQYFLPAWEEIRADLASNDPARAWRGFERAKAACQACHQAEGVPYMNDQPLFDLAAPQAAAR